MLSTVLRGIVAISIFVLASGAARADDHPPRILRDPILGLKYDIDKVKFEPLPEDVLSKCRTMASNENIQGRFWIYALVHDGTGTYYIIGGYGVRTHPEPPVYPRYESYDLGAVFEIDNNECTIFGEARETFDARYFEETPQRVLQKLADDAASQLARAFGGPDRLRAELRRQHINPRKLSPELKDAFKPYFGQ